MGRKSRKSVKFKLLNEELPALFVADAKDGKVFGVQEKGSPFHMTVHSNKERVRLHTKRRGKLEKVIIDTDEKTKFFGELEKELANILLANEVVSGKLFELKDYVIEKSEEIRSLKDANDVTFDALNFVFGLLLRALPDGAVADFSRPVEWKNVENHKLLSNEWHELLFVYNLRVYRLTSQQMADLYRFNNKVFGAGEIVKEFGLDPEILPQMFEKPKRAK